MSYPPPYRFVNHSNTVFIHTKDFFNFSIIKTEDVPQNKQNGMRMQDTQEPRQWLSSFVLQVPGHYKLLQTQNVAGCGATRFL